MLSGALCYAVGALPLPHIAMNVAACDINVYALSTELLTAST